MSQFYFNTGHQAPLNAHPQFPSAGSHNHHHHHHHSHHGGGRSRRAARFSSSHNPQRPFKNTRPAKDIIETTQAAMTRKDFEAARSFDLEDDEMFCPWHLLTEDDLHSIHSSSSDRSSLSSGSPDSSPLPHQLQPTPAPALTGNSHFQPHSSSYQQQTTSTHLKLHQPSAQRARNAIPIVDPNSRNTSPPQSVSPARQIQKQFVGRRW